MNLYQASIALLAAHAELCSKQQELSKAKEKERGAEESFAKAYFSNEADQLTTPLVIHFEGRFWLIEADEEAGRPIRIEVLSPLFTDPQREAR